MLYPESQVKYYITEGHLGPFSLLASLKFLIAAAVNDPTSYSFWYLPTKVRSLLLTQCEESLNTTINHCWRIRLSSDCSRHCCQTRWTFCLMSCSLWFSLARGVCGSYICLNHSAHSHYSRQDGEINGLVRRLACCSFYVALFNACFT